VPDIVSLPVALTWMLGLASLVVVSVGIWEPDRVLVDDVDMLTDGVTV